MYARAFRTSESRAFSGCEVISQRARWSCLPFHGRATDTLIPAVALPMSLLLTVAVMYMLNFSINNLTLMALTLAIGFLVDDAIVFLENVVRRAEHGESILKATFNSAGEISFT